MSFIHEDFLLQTETARKLYHEHARDLPIIDYHCHLPPQDVAVNRRFKNLYEIWLEGDHYKWRAMRTNGCDEKLCTGDADAYDKFMAWARTLPQCIRNPLYHWSHLELKRYFGIDTLLNEKTAPAIWAEANEKLASEEFSAHGILEKFKVAVVCTTDDPTDDLEHHKKIAQSGIRTRIYPTFRPDKSLLADQPAIFNPWTEKLAQVSGVECKNFDGFLNALKSRHDYFHSLGGRLSDHGLERCYSTFCSKETAEAIFNKARSGQAATAEEKELFASYLMEYYGHLDADKNWTKQLHVGAMRNNRSRLFKEIGPDIGFDSIGDYPQGTHMSRYLDKLDQSGKLPKTILYNLNPADNYLFATMIGNFQDGTVAGKIQFGSGWWFLDQKEGMELQMNALSNLGLLPRFVGMLTDSRSFLSYCRHEYFRRILCNLFGNDVENGELPNDMELLGSVIRNISYYNAKEYFGFEVPDMTS